MPRYVAAVLVVALAAALGARSVAGGDGDGAPSRGSATVTRVVDGDTAVLAGIGKARFIGVDTPEVYGHRDCFGPQASAYTKRMLDGRRVRYVIGREPRDRYGRALVYLWLADGRFFNQMLVSQGYARPMTIAPNVEHAELFTRQARTARERGRGLWEACSGR
ncbi:MAG: micrococcal nuclease [Solirubrobacteraceae bacterium]|jgi:micrococcal nuclease|nr:micrococcal nuclease [Solirubrobacteraceae bacterium]